MLDELSGDPPAVDVGQVIEHREGDELGRGDSEARGLPVDCLREESVRPRVQRAPSAAIFSDSALTDYAPSIQGSALFCRDAPTPIKRRPEATVHARVGSTRTKKV
jgi:hypothetical protein